MNAPVAGRRLRGLWSFVSELGAFPAAVVATLLPRRWRIALHISDDTSAMRYAAYLTGTLQAVSFFLLWFLLILINAGDVVGDLPNVDDAEADMAMRYATGLGVFVDPKGWLLLWFSFEGLCRIWGAAAGSILGLSPLWAIAQVGAGLAAGRARREAREVRPDRCVQEGEELVIFSRHPKPWSETCTLRIGGTLYRVLEEQLFDDPQHPHRYRLVPIDPAWLIRRVEEWPEPGSESGCGEEQGGDR